MSQHDEKLIIVFPIEAVIARRFCHGPRGWSIPLKFDPAAGVLLLSGIGALGRHLMGSDEERVGASQNARGVVHTAPRCNGRPDLIQRPGDGTLLGAPGVSNRPNLQSPLVN